MLFENRLKIHEDQFTNSDRKIADYLKRHQSEIIYKSLQDLSKAVGVGEASIIRFCKKLEYSGYQDLKIGLAKNYNVGNGEQVTAGNYIDLITKNMTQVIGDTKDILDKQQLDEAIGLLRRARRILFYGVGASGMTAEEARGRFFRIGYPTFAVTDHHYQVMESALLTEEDVLVAISLSGESADLNEAVKIARKHKASIIALTNYTSSTLAKLSSVILLTAGRENPIEGGSLIAKVSQLYVLDLLCTGLSLIDYEGTMLVKEQTMEALKKRKRS